MKDLYFEALRPLTVDRENLEKKDPSIANQTKHLPSVISKQYKACSI